MSLSYRLRSGVSCSLTRGHPTLTLNFPLKIIRLDPVWRGAFEGLASHEPLSFETIMGHASVSDPGKAERFLDSLVRKGFLERSGIAGIDELPLVSVIIPVWNRERMIAECLHSLKGLDYPLASLEIIVVDDASDDHTPKVVSGFEVKLISLPSHRNASFCRNRAAREAMGDVLAFMDSDCLADPLWLKELVPVFRDPSVGAVGGLVDAPRGFNGIDRYEQVKSPLKVYPWYKRSAGNDRFFYLPTCNLLVRKGLFLRLGGFREDLCVGEDVDLCWRVQDHGSEVEYRPVGRVVHKHRNRLSPFCSRRFQYGTSEPLLQKLHPERVKALLIPLWASLFWGAILLSFGLRSFPLALLGMGALVWDCSRKCWKTGQLKIPVRFGRVVLAVLRSHLSFAYHCCAFASRYYLLWAFLLLPLFPVPSLYLLGTHLLTGTVEYLIRRPELSLPVFLFYFSMDQLSYQTGVWWGCMNQRNFNAVSPRIKILIP
jgi:mycofactocin glycosyltransferase